MELDSLSMVMSSFPIPNQIPQGEILKALISLLCFLEILKSLALHSLAYTITRVSPCPRQSIANSLSPNSNSLQIVLGKIFDLSLCFANTLLKSSIWGLDSVFMFTIPNSLGLCI